MANSIVHFEIASKDTDKARQFYADAFGWPMDANNPMNYAMASTKDGDMGIDGGLYQVGDAKTSPTCVSTRRRPMTRRFWPRWRRRAARGWVRSKRYPA